MPRNQNSLQLANNAAAAVTAQTGWNPLHANLLQQSATAATLQVPAAGAQGSLMWAATRAHNQLTSQHGAGGSLQHHQQQQHSNGNHNNHSNNHSGRRNHSKQK